VMRRGGKGKDWAHLPRLLGWIFRLDVRRGGDESCLVFRGVVREIDEGGFGEGWFGNVVVEGFVQVCEEAVATEELRRRDGKRSATSFFAKRWKREREREGSHRECSIRCAFSW